MLNRMEELMSRFRSSDPSLKRRVGQRNWSKSRRYGFTEASTFTARVVWNPLVLHPVDSRFERVEQQAGDYEGERTDCIEPERQDHDGDGEECE